jgi:DNA-binding CsgD family transcriptional regulator
MTQVDLARLAEELNEASDLQSLWWSTARFFGDAGFGAVSYAVFDRGVPGEVSLLLRHGIADRIHQGFIDLGYGRHDVSYRYALATGRPSLRSQTLRETTMSPEEREHHLGREALNYGDTLAFPLFGPNNYTGVMSIGRPESVDGFEQAEWTLLHMGALAMHLKALQFQATGATEPHSLSEREVQVLCWVAQGKSNGVISDILSISAGTVDTYLRRIFEKLDVTDRTSAAVKGVSMGLIRI